MEWLNFLLELFKAQLPPTPVTKATISQAVITVARVRPMKCGQELSPFVKVR